jgi:acyl dehydratase
MAIDESLVGRKGEPTVRTWTSKDALLYALGVGAGQLDPLDELEFTTENSEGLVQKVFPTFACVGLSGGRPPMPEGADLSKMLHAEQGFTLHAAELPVEGEVTAVGSTVNVYDKGSGALVVNHGEAHDGSGQLVATLHGGLFFRGAGGWGGERGPAEEWEKPTGAPDHQVTYPIPADQALVYRLTGDRNPLHSDPKFAARGGFAKPILHGMCTYGFTGRALLHAVAGSDPARFRAMKARFAKTIFPGQTITINIWVDGTDVRFQTVDESGAVIIDRGSATIS